MEWHHQVGCFPVNIHLFTSTYFLPTSHNIRLNATEISPDNYYSWTYWLPCSFPLRQGNIYQYKHHIRGRWQASEYKQKANIYQYKLKLKTMGANWMNVAKGFHVRLEQVLHIQQKPQISVALSMKIRDKW